MGRDRVTAGKIRAENPSSPVAGNSSRRKLKNWINSNPTQKVGNEILIGGSDSRKFCSHVMRVQVASRATQPPTRRELTSATEASCRVDPTTRPVPQTP